MNRTRIAFTLSLLALTCPLAAQTTWLAEGKWASTKLPRTISTSALRPGDRIVVEVELYAGPKGPPTQLRLWTGQGFRRSGLAPGKYTFRYTSSSGSESLHFAIDGWDPDDKSRARIGREPRPNVTATLTPPQADRSVVFGYRVGNLALRPTQAIYADLYYANGGRRGTRLARKQINTGANSVGSFRIALPSTLPNGVTHLICDVDAGDHAAESNEGDNSVSAEIPNPQLTCRYQVEQSGNQRIQYLRATLSNPTGADFPHGVRVRLDYAQQDSAKSYLYHRHTTVFDVSYGVLRAHASQDHKIPCPTLPMPAGHCTHVFATLELRGGVERTADDNTRVLPISIGPEFVRVGGKNGVGVHQQHSNDGPVHVVVVDLRTARVASLVTPPPPVVPNKVGTWWDLALRGRAAHEALVAMSNGTYFAGDGWYLSSVSFTKGLKVAGTVHTLPENDEPWHLAFQSGRVSIHRYGAPRRLYSDPVPDILGGVSILKPLGHAQQSWMAVRDRSGTGGRGEQLHATLLLFTGQRKTFTNKSLAIHTMRGLAEMLGCDVGTPDQPKNIMLTDGGGSRTLRYRSDSGPVWVTKPATGRFLPHVLAFYGLR